MNILRSILVGLASFTFLVAITGIVYLLTLQTTVMDRTVVKGWLSESNLYDGRLIDTLAQTATVDAKQTTQAPQATTDELAIPPEAVKAALKATFTPDFTQTQVEGVVDKAYNWIDGTSPTFTFSVPIDQKRETLIAELAKRIEPQLASLPVCRSLQLTQNATCRPPNISTAQLATDLTTESIDKSGAFAAPITNESFSKANQQPEQNTASQLPAIHDGITLLLIALPIIAILSLVVIISATQNGHRLARVARLSRRVFFGMLFIFLPTAIVVWLARDSDLGLANLFNAQTSALAVPLIKTILVSILTQLALTTGIAGIVSVVTWIVLSLIQRRTATLPPATPFTPPTSEPQPVLRTTPLVQLTPRPAPPAEPTPATTPYPQAQAPETEPDTQPTNYQR